jgi:hypothetical protein
MLGIKDPWVFSAYTLTIISGLICVIYGLINWNKGAETEAKEVSKAETSKNRRVKNL